VEISLAPAAAEAVTAWVAVDSAAVAAVVVGAAVEAAEDVEDKPNRGLSITNENKTKHYDFRENFSDRFFDRYFLLVGSRFARSGTV
jgi:hypothetical protein